MAQGPSETEVKIRILNEEGIVGRLAAAGFTESVPRVFESNTLYDTPERSLQGSGTMLRLRQAGEKAVITWKGRKVPGPHKSRPELETGIGSYDTLHAILIEIGFQPSFRYEKFRTEYHEAGRDGVVTLDETPIGWFLELEGVGEWIDRTAQRLEFTQFDYILDSYGKLYLADCEKRQSIPGNMTFASGN